MRDPRSLLSPILITIAVWLRDLRLRPRPSALAGAAAGLAVGGLITFGMVRNATFTGPHQDLTAGAIIVALWLAIGIIAGLTVLSPDDDEDAA